MALGRVYNGLGMAHKDTLAALITQHGIILSTLKSMLRTSSLLHYICDDLAPIIIHYILLFILDQLQGPGNFHGYRWMHKNCVENGLWVRNEDVHIILSELDPERDA